MPRPMLALAALAIVLPGAAAAQEDLNRVQWFRSASQDARVAPASYVEGNVFHTPFDFGSYTYLAARFALVPSPRMQLEMEISHFTSSSDFGEGSSGLTDPIVTFKYNFASTGPTQFSAGAFGTLPIGSDEVGEGDLDAGVFVAVRRPVAERTVVGGRFSVDYFEFEKDDRNPSMRLAGGVIHRVGERVSLLGEVLVQTSGVSEGATITNLSAGVDYALGERSHLRGAFGTGLTDSSPGTQLILSFLHYLRN